MHKYILDTMRKEIQVDVSVFISSTILRPHLAIISILQNAFHPPFALKHTSAGQDAYLGQSQMVTQLQEKVVIHMAIPGSCF